MLTELIAEELSSVPRDRSRPQLPTALLANHVAATFVLVLDWWIDNDVPLTPAEVDAPFRTLIVPTLGLV